MSGEEVLHEMENLVVTLVTTTLPPNYTCDGEDKSPAIQVGGVSPAVRSLVLMMLDASAGKDGPVVHWLFYDVEPARIIPEKVPPEPRVAFPIAGSQGKNDFGSVGYRGPCPPGGTEHRYDIKVYGMDTVLGLPPGCDRGTLARAMGGHVIAFGQTSVQVGR